ncbi:hypothetical protein AB0O82_06270 [Kitasatospora sp. NPDC088264]
MGEADRAVLALARHRAPLEVLDDLDALLEVPVEVRFRWYEIG